MEHSPLPPPGKSTDRLIVAGLILSGWALIVLLRLLDLQVFSHSELARRALRQQDKLIEIEAQRGAIFDRDGNYLAISSPSRFVVVDPKRIPNKELAAALLAKILGLDPAKLDADLEAAARSRRHNGYFVVDQRVSPEKAAQLQGLNLDWLEIRDGSLRSYPNGQLAAHVLGNVNAEGQGAAGIELKLNQELAGTPGWKRVEVDVNREPYESEIVKTPEPGKNIGLTIDSEIEHIAEEALQDAVLKNHAEHGSVVAIDPRNGEILALANYPTYDPNERLPAGERPHGREDLAVVAPYEPGSVFKVITLSAALETTHLTPNTIIPCGGGVLHIFGRTIHDAERHGDLSMADVLAKSSNVGAIHIGMEVGAKEMYDYVRRFGVGQRTGIELPAEAPGMLRPLRRWQATSLASISFGHEVSMTTLQLARMGSVIASGGYLVHPHLVAWTQIPGGPKEYTKEPPPVRVLEPQTVATMRWMMRRVVMPGGTAARLHLVGYSLAGKTGTAQIFDYEHHVYTHKYNASFIGFAPVNNPSILIAVTIYPTTGEAGFGASAAGPAFQAIADAALRILNVPRDVPEEVEAMEQKELAEKARVVKSAAPRDMDDDALADLSVPPSPEETAAAQGDSAIAANGVKVPDFTGKTVQGVVEEAAQEGLQVDLLGDGLARAQQPAPGSLLIPGEHVRVRFAR
jgi:cell division protein FtsI (penicillin-binding protein 3)